MQNSAPLLSVVVAVYNGEAFLDQFFTCLVNQHIDSMEVIIVNDGSTDRSMQIVEKWREKLPKMQVIEQPNQGVSIARNTGLAVATGQYLSFPDIDDVFKPGMYQRLLDMVKSRRTWMSPPAMATTSGKITKNRLALSSLKISSPQRAS